MTEHFTTAFYFDRLAQSTHRMMDACSTSRPQLRDCLVRYFRELNPGDVFHIESCVTEAEEGRFSFGHKLIDSATGELCTTFEQRFVGTLEADTRSFQAEWDGPEREERADVPAQAKWLPACRDVVRGGETDWRGELDLSGYVHRFSTAAAQCQSHIGLTPTLMREERRGFSTFEFQLSFDGPPPRAGDGVQVKSTVAHVGTTSLRLVFRMERSATGELLALLSQMGVNLDLDERRPAAIPLEIARKARSVMGDRE